MFEAIILADFIRHDRFAGADRVPGRGGRTDRNRRLADDIWSPAEPGTHQQSFVVLLQFQDFGKVCVQRAAPESARLGQDLVEVIGSEREFAEASQSLLLLEQLTGTV